jgi:hypothetical protein
MFEAWVELSEVQEHDRPAVEVAPILGKPAAAIEPSRRAVIDLIPAAMGLANTQHNAPGILIA